MNGFDDAWLADYEARMQRLRVPARQLSISRPGATAGQHAQAAAPAVNAEGNAGSIVRGDVCAPRKNKYGATPTHAPDPCGSLRKYASKREAKRARQLAEMKARGEIADFFPQASFPFGIDEKGNQARYVADFLVIEEYLSDGRFVGWVEDPKGADTERSRAKRAALRARGLDVRLI